MPVREVLCIDGFDLSAPGEVIAIEAGTPLWKTLNQLDATWHIEHEEYEAKERQISTKAAEFISRYKPEEADSVFAIFWRYGVLSAEEFATVADAESFLESGEEYGTLAGEAVVASDGTITVCD